jgi:diadenosine tetraphosphate (Ap4A) HIT family hydrolase
MTMSPTCELCSQDGGEVLWRNEKLRVVLVDDAQYPGFCRVIWNAHMQEMTDLPPAERDYLMQAVWQVEAAVRSVMQPDKINVASLGNVVPHLHWHVIPRCRDDAHFPAPVWAAKQREPDAAMLAARRAKLPALRAGLLRALTNSPSP